MAGTSNVHWIRFVRVHMQVHWMCISSMLIEYAHSFNPHREVDWKWIWSELRLKCMGKVRSHVIQFLPIPHPIPQGTNEESWRTALAKYWQDVWQVDSRRNKGAEGSPFPSSLSRCDYHVAKNCHAFNSHQIASPQSLIWTCTMCIEFTSLSRMRIQCTLTQGTMWMGLN